MDYFNLLPDITYQGIPLKDISVSVKLSGVDAYLEEYQLSDNEDVYDVAFNVYGKDELFWLIYLVNPELPFYKIKTTKQFSDYMDQKYKGSGIELYTDNKGYTSVEVFVDGDSVQVDRIDRTRNQLFLSEYVNGDIIVRLTYQNSVVSLSNDSIGFYNSSRLMPSYFVYNDEYYIEKPNDIAEKITWQDYEIQENEKLRTIKIIPQKYVESVISEVQKFIENRV